MVIVDGGLWSLWSLLKFILRHKTALPESVVESKPLPDCSDSETFYRCRQSISFMLSLEQADRRFEALFQSSTTFLSLLSSLSLIQSLEHNLVVVVVFIVDSILHDLFVVVVVFVSSSLIQSSTTSLSSSL